MSCHRLADDRGSTIPLILGFFAIGLLMIAGAIALGQAFVQQRDLQDVCDAAAVSAAASAADLNRIDGVGADTSLRFEAVQRAVDDFLARDRELRDVRVDASLMPGAERIALTCSQTRTLTLGALFGQARVRHVAHSTSRGAVIGALHPGRLVERRS